MMSFFAYPLRVQNAAFDNLTFFLPSAATPWAQRLPRNRPGATPCDYVVAAFREETAFGIQYVPVSEGEVRRWVPRDVALEHIGDAGRYRAWHVIPR